MLPLLVAAPFSKEHKPVPVQYGVPEAAIRQADVEVCSLWGIV